MLAAIAAATSRVRLVAAAILAPLRHPLLLAKQLATLDLLSGGRLVVQPTVSWHRPEYEALGCRSGRPRRAAGRAPGRVGAAWGPSPASFDGAHYPFTDVYLEPKPFRPGGPDDLVRRQRLHARLLARLVRYGSGFHPLGQPTEEELARHPGRDGRGRPRSRGAGDGRRHPRGVPTPDGVADLGRALETIPAQVERGFPAICFKPSQFTDDPAEVGAFCRDVVERVDALVR